MSDPQTRMREWRRLEGLTLDEVSGLTGISVPMLSLVERGQRNMSPRARVAMARRLNVPLRELFDIEPTGEGAA